MTPGPGISAPGIQGSVLFGTVVSVGANSFTVDAASGQTVTVNEQASTLYYQGTSRATSSAVVQGARVVVQGSRSGNNVQAIRVLVLNPVGFGG